MDQYQQRYLVHQQRKQGELLELMRKRHADRIFTNQPMSAEILGKIVDAAHLAPSSCNREGVRIHHVAFRDNKELLSGLLVGGVGWLHRADHIMLLIGDKIAYKEGLKYMPYLDAGFIAQNIWLACTELGVGCCFVNPNVRKDFRPILKKYFIRKNEILCGVIAMGYTE